MNVKELYGQISETYQLMRKPRSAIATIGLVASLAVPVSAIDPIDPCSGVCFKNSDNAIGGSSTIYTSWGPGSKEVYLHETGTALQTFRMENPNNAASSCDLDGVTIYVTKGDDGRVVITREGVSGARNLEQYLDNENPSCLSLSTPPVKVK